MIGWLAAWTASFPETPGGKRVAGFPRRRDGSGRASLALLRPLCDQEEESASPGLRVFRDNDAAGGAFLRRESQLTFSIPSFFSASHALRAHFGSCSRSGRHVTLTAQILWLELLTLGGYLASSKVPCTVTAPDGHGSFPHPTTRTVCVPSLSSKL
jgi:hypothetical protein